MGHLKNNNLFPDEQHGFLPGRSTTTAIINVAEYLIKAIEKGNTTTAIFLDYSKAFDSLSHDILLRKLNKLGFTGQSEKWFRSYITGRTQAVEISTVNNNMTQKTISDKLVLSKGVPQGSILGPVLFIIYVSDLPGYLNNYCNSLMYADDTVLLLQNKTPENLEIESSAAMNKIKEYCQANDLILNEKKSQQLVIGRRRKEVEAIPQLIRVDQAKYLGVIIDNQLSWNSHIDEVCKKLNSALYVLRRLKQICCENTVKIAYFALFESHLRYGLTVWGGSSKGNLQRVLLIQKKAIRILADLGQRDSCRESFKNLNILTVVCLYILETTLFACKQNMIRRGDIHGHQTRSVNNFALPVHRLKIFEEQPSYNGAKFWNILPEEIKNNKVMGFRRAISKWLLNLPFYSVKEFECGHYEL